MGYSVVAACVVSFRASLQGQDSKSVVFLNLDWREGVICLLLVALGFFGCRTLLSFEHFLHIPALSLSCDRTCSDCSFFH
ncbi:hypothetical protein TorRG33x02_293160 [Trema orientale]|uniref:Uncharacterized protein n=1 Tax=Trema orientale TaxID=63057 RepID=A0A2P5C9K3_TREOI|nr:hypothetical protein TorRG33x02_293160 [Trema orientale]